MMARAARFPMSFLVVVFVVCGLISQTEMSVVRVRRQQDCQDGTYEHDGRVCCKCAAGSSVEAHCTDRASTRCKPCEVGKEYQIHANSQTRCEPCTSCEQPNANLEVDVSCTPVADATCKCQDGHYCPTKPCKICDPCEVCETYGIKVACSANNNTICHDKSQDDSDNTVGRVLAILCGCVAVIAVVVALYCWKKRRTGSNIISNGNEETPEESLPLQPLLERLGPHIPDVAEVIGWTTMRNLAIKSGINSGIIDNCMVDNPNNSIERTIALLKIWEEKEGKDASKKLVQYLKDAQLNRKAEEVVKILGGENGLKNV
ncbi:tumor necrosis factor receptor superfamily member 6 [Eucyclogobius newberryi]|uniref:tumor necrosis factor receptor superfamily member 6 n=1 Tax=Eucyclogobius newberryi TaxID=166745 RepID=UPI003B591ABC